MKSRHEQKGLTAIGMVMLLSCIAFFALFAIRLIPIYIESFKVDNAMKTLKEEEKIAQKSSNEVRELLLKRLGIDDVEHVKSEHINIIKESDSMKVEVAYEVKTPLFSHIQLLATFDKSVEVPL